MAELQAWLNLTPFSAADYRRLVHQLCDLARQTDRGIVLAEALIELLRQERIIVPALEVIERVCSEALTWGTRQFYEALTAPLAEHLERNRGRCFQGDLPARGLPPDAGIPDGKNHHTPDADDAWALA